MEIIKGKSILNKVAIGPILYHRKTESQVKRRTVEDTEAEVKRYEMAVACAEDELKILHEKACEFSERIAAHNLSHTSGALISGCKS